MSHVEQGGQTPELQLSRRRFLRIAATAAGYVTLDSLMGPQAPPAQAQTPTTWDLVAAGDIAGLGHFHKETADIVRSKPGAKVAVLGDTAYPAATAAALREFYDPAWGPFLPRTFAVLGNHDNPKGPAHPNGNPEPFYNYFGDKAPRPGYYSFNLGNWHIIALNSEPGAVDENIQRNWLTRDLMNNRDMCTLVVWHEPIFSSTPSAQNDYMRPSWKVLDQAPNVALVLSASAHNYERFKPQDSAGVAHEQGIRQFVVGTGGAPFSGFGTPTANREVWNNNTYGVLQITLKSNREYDWQFIPIAGQTFTDSGSGVCPTRPNQLTTQVFNPIALK